jgi:hypothetical protein
MQCNKWSENCVWREGAKWQIADIPKPQWWLTTLKKENWGTQKTPTKSHNQWEAKLSLNPWIEKQPTTGKMGRMTPARHSWSPAPEASTWLHSSVLGGKSCFPAHVGTQRSTLPLLHGLLLHTLKCQGNLCPCISRTQGSCCSTGNRRCKPAGLVPSCL